MSLARYFVFQAGNDWMVMFDGEIVGRHRARQQALDSAVVMADLMGSMQHDADVMIEADGRLDLAWIYGRDRLPGEQGAAA